VVIGLGDIVDGGGLPVDNNGNPTTKVCQVAVNWQTQWKDARSAVAILNSNGIYYQPTIGNHDYDCQSERPQSRSASNYFWYFGQLPLPPTGYIRDSSGQRTPNFYKIMKIGSINYMILSLEFFPRSWVVSAVNSLITSFPGPVIIVTHGYLSYDGSGPTFGSNFPAGTAYPLCSGFAAGVYNCQSGSFRSFYCNPPGSSTGCVDGTDGISLWYKVFSVHPNLFMVLSGHTREPSPGDYPTVPDYNGVGRVDCKIQSWTTLCSNPNRPIQILSDFQGQGNNGYFGYGYLRIVKVSPSTRSVAVITYSPSIQKRPANFPATIPYFKKDSYNQFTMSFPPSFGGPNGEVTHITAPLDGSHVSLTFPISASAKGPDNVAHMEIYVDGVKQSDYPGVSALPGSASVTLPGAGLHRVVVQTYNTTKAVWVKSVIYVRNP